MVLRREFIVYLIYLPWTLSHDKPQSTRKHTFTFCIKMRLNEQWLAGYDLLHFLQGNNLILCNEKKFNLTFFQSSCLMIASRVF